jgi:Leucine-rich repeat (LRR) protein
VFLQRNRGLELPDIEQVYLPNLIFLIYSENNVTIPLDFFHADRFPNLGNLFINGNNLEDFPPSIESLKNNMAALGIARTGIRNLPSFIAELKGLHYIDARDNKISIVDGAVEEFFRERKPNQAYFSGNEICETAAKEYLDCEPLCSKYCFSRYSQDKNCDLGCYTKACEYDGGDCDL